MTIETDTLCRAIDGDRSRLKDELYAVIHESLSDDPGIDVEFYGPAETRVVGEDVDPEGFVINGYRVDPVDGPEYDHEIRLRASYDHRLPAGGDTARTREQVEATLIYKLELELSPLVYSGDVAVFVIPKEW